MIWADLSTVKPSAAVNRQRHFNGGLLLSVAVLIIPFTSYGEVPWLTGPFALLVAVVFVAAMRFAAREKIIQVPAFPIHIPLAMALGLCLTHLLWSQVPYSSLLFLVHLSVAATLYYILIQSGDGVSPETVVLVWMIILVPWVAIQLLFLGSKAPIGPFLNPNYTATVLLVCLAMALGSQITVRTKKPAAAAMLASAVLCSFCLVLIGSRSAGLGVILLWTAHLVLGRGRMRWLAILVIAVIILFPNTIRYRVTEGYKSDPHAFSRIQIWQAAIKMGTEHPVAGVGPNLFNDYGPLYAFPTEELPVRYGRIARKPHNEYLKSWAEGGVVGVFVLGFFLYIVMRMAVPAISGDRAGPAMATGILLYQGLFHDVTEVFALMVLLAWCVAQLTPVRERAVDPGKRIRGLLPVASVILITVFSLFLSVDLVSRSLWLKGQDLIESDIHTAREAVSKAATLNPILPGAARDLARIELMMNSREQGEGTSAYYLVDVMRKALRLNRLDTVPLRLEAAHYISMAGKGEIKASQGLAKAAARLREALLIEPRNALIMLSLSDVLWDLNQRGRAMEMLEEAMVTEPNYLQAHRTRILRLKKLGSDRVAWAEEELNKAKERAAGYKPQSDYEEIILR